ncbi:MAG TPA: hydroxysqualene dehydroxylase HpnE [Dehalococcoidia bacterium]|nr:hydroxysqualene dehydroxylase HpnE [Dehalococcoidia bacterium]
MRVAVLGAGLAGLAAACELADRRHQVTVFERRPWAGGKTYSFVERETGEQVDNGQHIFMPCMTAYTAFLAKLGTLGFARRQRRMRVPVLDADGRRSDLWAAPLPPPLHLGPSFAAYRHLSATDKLRVARGVLAISRLPRSERDALQGESFGAWLRRHGASETALRGFWDLIVVPALNARSDAVSAAQALFVFQEGFLKSPSATAICVPATGLSELHVAPAVRYIEARGGAVRLGTAVDRIEVGEGRVPGIITSTGERETFDAYVAALPPRELCAVLPESVRGLEPFASLSQYRFSPIVNLHLWFDRPLAPFVFAAFTGCELQWLFNRRLLDRDATGPAEHLVVSLSAAEAYLGLSKRELQERFLPQLRRALPRARGAKLLRCVAIKEPEATFVAAPGLMRPGPRTPLANLVLTGAYTDTGWPATMESAVRSGQAAARSLTPPRT